MANTVIQLKKSNTAASRPSSLADGEIAVNRVDGILYYKNSNGTVAHISTGGGGGNNFGTVNANNTLVVSDTPGDIITFIGGADIEIVGDAATDTVYFYANNLTRAYNQANTVAITANSAFTRANLGIKSTTSLTSPSANSGGDRWFDTSVGAEFVWVNDGDSGAWVEVGTGGGNGGSSDELAFAPPTTATFATQRADTGVIENISSNRGVRIRFTAPGTVTNSHLYALTPITSGAGGWQAIARIKVHGWLINFVKAGMSIRDSVSGKSQIIGFAENYTLNNNWYSADTTQVSGTAYTGISEHDAWFKLMEDGTNRKFYYSLDGDYWQLVFSATIASQYVTAPTHVGFGWNAAYNTGSIGAGTESAVDCLSWSQVAL